jgi:hypothetical protein
LLSKGASEELFEVTAERGPATTSDVDGRGFRLLRRGERGRNRVLDRLGFEEMPLASIIRFVDPFKKTGCDGKRT